MTEKCCLLSLYPFLRTVACPFISCFLNAVYADTAPTRGAPNPPYFTGMPGSFACQSHAELCSPADKTESFREPQQLLWKLRAPKNQCEAQQIFVRSLLLASRLGAYGLTARFPRCKQPRAEAHKTPKAAARFHHVQLSTEPFGYMQLLELQI